MKTNNTETLNVLYQSNDSYAVITGVSMTSLMENNKNIADIRFFILDDMISEDNKQRMSASCKKYGRKIEFINTEVILQTLRELHVAPFKGTYTTYFKLFAIDELDLNNHRVLQLDGDTIIDGSLKELCEFSLKDTVCAATYDCTMNSYKKLIDIPLTDKYYNCGVLLINQKVWREDNCQDRIVEHLQKVRKGYYTVDQDIINVLFRDKIKYLDLMYNFNSGFYIYGIEESLKMYDLKPGYYNTPDEVLQTSKKPVIYHCMGAMTGRPWEQNNIHPQSDIFDHYLSLSAWSDYKKIRVNRSKIFNTQRVLYQILPRPLYIPLHKFAQKRYLTKMNRSVQK